MSQLHLYHFVCPLIKFRSLGKSNNEVKRYSKQYLARSGTSVLARKVRFVMNNGGKALSFKFYFATL